jgi:Fic family protein
MDSILELIGRCQKAPAIIRPELLRHNRNRAIQASLSIEGNTLSLTDVAAIAEGIRPPAAPPREVLEVENALALYEQASSFNAYSADDLLRAHGLLMRGLVEQAGCFRLGGVGIHRGRQVVHVAPPAGRVPGLVRDLLGFLKDGSAHWLARSCVFHYEFEFIHPFPDGNGRMGRFWQTLFLATQRPVLAVIPVETILKERQHEYYAALGEADDSGDSSVFIEFMLAALRDALISALPRLAAKATPEERLRQAATIFQEQWFDRRTYLAQFAGLAPLAASRDLARGVAQALLERQGDRRDARYRFHTGGCRRSVRPRTLPRFFT